MMTRDKSVPFLQHRGYGEALESGSHEVLGDIASYILRAGDTHRPSGAKKSFEDLQESPDPEPQTLFPPSWEIYIEVYSPAYCSALVPCKEKTQEEELGCTGSLEFERGAEWRYVRCLKYPFYHCVMSTTWHQKFSKKRAELPC